ncbi:MAG: DUF3040 domain-containing protein [Actinomycetota bacterium]|nr:DUF3040 domain-containing protein [Sporichthyaceae bacterium]MDQ3113310.1 DUF3040 domain-containing protein [Actinomycetota bacterium]MDQ3450722.1 DUF3040 domain-containing protein [Actinomycetota bacterium]
MPLSDHEQRLLEQMEQALYAEDPRFASVLQGEDLRVRYRRRLVIAVLGFVAGVALLMSGLVFQVILVSVLGFVVMLVSVLVGVSAYRRSPHDGAGQPFVAPSNVHPIGAGRRKRGLMERVEERWQRRRDES